MDHCDEQRQKLRNLKRKDVQDAFNEEREQDHPNKSTVSSDEHSEDDNLDEPEKKKIKIGSAPSGHVDFAQRMMLRMGYKEGSGLGKHSQGISEPIALSATKGRVGFGHEANKVISRNLDVTWDESKEKKTVEEAVEWMTPSSTAQREEAVRQLKNCTGKLTGSGRDGWMEIKEKKMKIEDELEWCSEKTLLDMLEAKKVFDRVDDRDLREARARANPYETIGGAFFQNRAAMKTANLDKVFDWLLTGEDPETLARKNPLDDSPPLNEDRQKPLFYFADVCAGPGGFSEYVLWRKGFYNAKGFGFTLAGKDDFKLGKFCASSQYYFEPFYGTKGNGDVMDPENIDSLEAYVLKGTNGVGVDLMMADGGFSVEGQENLQEILSKRLYLCQMLVSLCIVREGGNFFCKLFDIFTEFSAGLIYLMRICYDEVSLHKPHTSRPANSERYIICKGLRKEYSDVVRDYLKTVNRKMDMLKDRADPNDVQAIVALEVMREDEVFHGELYSHNEMLAKRQTVYLEKYLNFSRNQGLFDKDQGDLRDECLRYWMVPNRPRTRDRDRIQRSLNPQLVLGTYSTKIFGDKDFVVRSPDFHPHIFRPKYGKHLKSEEFRFVRLSQRSHPALLVSTTDAVFVHGQNWDKEDLGHMRIPGNTVLLVESGKTVTVENNRLLPNGDKYYRILDAAVLNGDNVAHLPFEERMEAATKFCESLKLVRREIKIGWGYHQKNICPYKLVVAQTYKLSDLETMKQDMELVTFRNESAPLFTEGGVRMRCEALRFSRAINTEWSLSWSKSNSKIYAFNPKTNESIFQEEFQKRDIIASFWETAILKESEAKEVKYMLEKDPEKANVTQCIWKWSPDPNNEYGPKMIMEGENEYKGKPTVTSLHKRILEMDASSRDH